MKHRDAYKSVYESLDHAGIANRRARDRPADRGRGGRAATAPSASWAASTASSCRAGSACAASRGRSRRSASPATRGIPFFGICLGLQCAVIEFARNVLGLDDANSTEFDKTTAAPGRSALMDDQSAVRQRGGTMRLGSCPCVLAPEQPGPAGLRRRRDPRAAPAPLRVQQRVPQAVRGERLRRRPARAPTASSSRSSSCPTTPGSWPCSSTPSSSRSRPRPIRSSATSSPPLWRAARGSRAGAAELRVGPFARMKAIAAALPDRTHGSA